MSRGISIADDVAKHLDEMRGNKSYSTAIRDLIPSKISTVEILYQKMERFRKDISFIKMPYALWEKYDARMGDLFGEFRREVKAYEER